MPPDSPPLRRRRHFHTRLALPCDAPSLVRAILAVSRAGGNTKIAPHSIRELLEILLTDPSARIVVADDEFGDFAGAAIANASENACSGWYLSLVFVDEDVRREGIFRRLCTTLCELAHRERVDDIHALVDPQNDSAMAAFFRVGFEPCHFYGMRLNVPQFLCYEVAKDAVRSMGIHDRSDVNELGNTLYVKTMARAGSGNPRPSKWALFREGRRVLVRSCEEARRRKSLDDVAITVVAQPDLDAIEARDAIEALTLRLTSSEREFVAAWLEFNGDHDAVARALGIAPRSIPRRLARLKERLLGAEGFGDE